MHAPSRGQCQAPIHNHYARTHIYACTIREANTNMHACMQAHLDPTLDPSPSTHPTHTYTHSPTHTHARPHTYGNIRWFRNWLGCCCVCFLTYFIRSLGKPGPTSFLMLRACWNRLAVWRSHVGSCFFCIGCSHLHRGVYLIGRSLADRWRTTEIIVGRGLLPRPTTAVYDQ